jgi:hypothetical protein
MKVSPEALACVMLGRQDKKIHANDDPLWYTWCGPRRAPTKPLSPIFEWRIFR